MDDFKTGDKVWMVARAGRGFRTEEVVIIEIKEMWYLVSFINDFIPPFLGLKNLCFDSKEECDKFTLKYNRRQRP